MIQDIITYMIVLYALSYTVYHTARIFIPERKKVKLRPCSSCKGCDLKDGLSMNT